MHAKRPNDPSAAPPRSRRSVCGLTLVEIMMATAILSIVFAAFLISFTTARRTAAMARNQIHGVNLARDTMEQLLLSGFNSAALSVGTHTLTSGQYVVSLDTSNAAIKTVNLSIWWSEPLSSITSSVSLQTTVTTSLHP